MTSRSVTLGMLDAYRVELTDQRIVVGLGQELLDQQIDHASPCDWALASAKTGCSMPPSRAISASMVGLSMTIEVGSNMPWRTLRGSKVSGGRGRGGNHLVLAVDEAQAAEDQPHGLAEAAPFQRDAVDLGLDVVARHVGGLGDAILQEIEVDGTCHQAKAGHQDERRDGEDDAPTTCACTPDTFA